MNITQAELQKLLSDNDQVGAIIFGDEVTRPVTPTLSIDEIHAIKDDVHGPDYWLEVLEGERPVSWNDWYAGKHWSVRSREANRVHALVQDAFARCGLFKRRVDISVVVYFDKYPLDSCNIPAKIYIDGLLGTVIADDSREYVRYVSTRSEVDKECPRVEIEVHTITEDQPCN